MMLIHLQQINFTRWCYRSEVLVLPAEHGWKSFRDVTQLSIAEVSEFLPYWGVIVDEAQDMSSGAFSLLRAIVDLPRVIDLLLIKDAHQRIHDTIASLINCSIAT